MIVEYIKEIIYRVIYTLLGGILIGIIAYKNGVELIFILSIPLAIVLGDMQFVLLGIFDILVTYMKMAFIFLIFTVFVLGMYNLLLYIIPSIEELKIKKITNILVKIHIFIFAVLYIIYKYILIILLNYVLKMAKGLNNYNIDIQLKLYIGTLLKITVFFMLLIILPIILVNILKESQLNNYKGLYIVFIGILIMIFLPADMLLHIVGLIVGWLVWELSTIIVKLRKQYVLLAQR